MLWLGLRAVIAPALAPWIGIGARVLTADALKLVGVGVLLWIGAAVWVWYWIRPQGGKLPEGITTGILVFTLQFATFYTLAVLVTGAFVRH